MEKTKDNGILAFTLLTAFGASFLVGFTILTGLASTGSILLDFALVGLASVIIALIIDTAQ